MLAVRDDVPTSTPVDGDYVALKTDDEGKLHTTGGSTTVLDNVEETTEIADTDIFAADVTVPADGIVLIEFVTDTSLVLSVQLTRSATTRVAALNSGNSIAADSWFVFEFPVKSGDTINLQGDTGADVTAMLSFQRTA